MDSSKSGESLSSWGMVKGVVSHLCFTKNDANGFIQLFFDNAGTILVLIGLMLNVVWVPGDMTGQSKDFKNEVNSIVSTYANEIVWQRVIPGVAFATLLGNFFYALLSCYVSYKQNTYGQVTALPYGVNTPAAFAFVFSVLLPAMKVNSLDCVASTDTTPTDLASCYTDAIEASWKAGVLCNFLAGLMAAAFGFFGKIWAKYTPIGVLLSALATVCVAFLCINQLTGNFGNPISGLLPLFIMLIGYGAEVPFAGIPTSFVIVLVGTILGWANGAVTAEDVSAAVGYVKFYGVESGVSALSDWSNVGGFIGVVVPLAIQASASSLMNVKSAAAVGDTYPLRPSMIWDGCCSMFGALLGTCFMTTIYIGHPAYKYMGASNGYSLLNAIVFLLVSLSGLFALVNAIVPSTAIGPVIIFVGIMISKDAIISMKPHQAAPVFVFAIIPGLADFMAQNGASYSAMNTAFFGIVALGKSSILFALFLASIVYFTLDRNFKAATGWSLIAGFAASVGLIHQTTASVTDYSAPMGEYCVPRTVLNINETESCPENFAPCADDSSLCGYIYTTRWRFLVTYLMLASTFFILWMLQRYTDRVPGIVDVETAKDAEITIDDSTQDTESSSAKIDLESSPAPNTESVNQPVVTV